LGDIQSESEGGLMPLTVEEQGRIQTEAALGDTRRAERDSSEQAAYRKIAVQEVEDADALGLILEVPFDPDYSVEDDELVPDEEEIAANVDSNCGIGSGGFQKGNTCARSGGGTETYGSEAPLKSLDKAPSKHAAEMLDKLILYRNNGPMKDSVTPPPPGRAYTPDVTEVGRNGMTVAARVGVSAHEVPPPPKLQPLPGLTPHERKAEQDFMLNYEMNPEKVAGDYWKIVQASTKPGEPKTFSTDDAKVLSDAWNKDVPVGLRSINRATLNTVLHQTANAIAKRSLLAELDTLKPGDQVLVTVGGCGSGKGFCVNNVPQALAEKAKSKVVWDSAGDQNATENPWVQKEAEKRGLKVAYVYVHADPHTQWSDPNKGVMSRAANPNDGRMVDAKVFADSYEFGAKNHQAFYEANKTNKNAKFVFLDNTGIPKLTNGIPAAALKVNRKELAEYAIGVAKDHETAPSYVKRGALLGERIWPND
jgi:hypothetical protein